MQRCLAVLLLSLAACSPTLDWREVPSGPAGLHVALPCKPSTAERRMPMLPGRPDVALKAMGCEAGGAAFAVLAADIGDPVLLGPALAQWRQATLAGVHGQSQSQAAFVPKGALALPDSVQMTAQGRGPDGASLETRAAYFARGTTVYQAMVHAPKITPAMADPFFAGLRFE